MLSSPFIDANSVDSAEPGITKELQIKKCVLAWDHLHLTAAQLGQADNKELLSSHLLLGISWTFFNPPYHYMDCLNLQLKRQSGFLMIPLVSQRPGSPKRSLILNWVNRPHVITDTLLLFWSKVLPQNIALSPLYELEIILFTREQKLREVNKDTYLQLHHLGVWNGDVGS